MPPVFAHGQLRLYLLSLLEHGPRHGYELITALSEQFGGTYRPSAGTVYPRLSRLEEEGLVRRTAAGRKSPYELTDAGRTELADHREELVALEHDLADTVRRLAEQVRHEVTGSMAGLRADLAAAAQEARAAAGRVAAAGAESWRAAGGPAEEVRTGAAVRREARVRRVEAEAELTRFREDVRVALRLAESRGELPVLTVETVRTVLTSARAAITATLPR
ncbi:MAG TPA: PadR family transcriptional regulator [Cellulomonas sp.]